MPLSALFDRWPVRAPGTDKAPWLASCVFAHRGLHGSSAAENSLDAFAAAVARGFGIECDVQRSSDGQAVVFHDWELDRMTALAGPVAQLTARQLGETRLVGGGTIPTLNQALAAVAGKTPLLIEVKSRRGAHVSALCLAVRRALEGYRGPHAVISFDPRVSRWFAIHSPLTVRGLSFTDENDHTLPAKLRRRLSLRLARPDFITYDLRDLPNRFASTQRRRGLPLVGWTVTTPEQRARAESLCDAWIGEGVAMP